MFHRGAPGQTSGTGIQVERRLSVLDDAHANCTPNLTADGLTSHGCPTSLPTTVEPVTLGTKQCVLISRVSSFRRENIIWSWGSVIPD